MNGEFIEKFTAKSLRLVNLGDSALRIRTEQEVAAAFPQSNPPELVLTANEMYVGFINANEEQPHFTIVPNTNRCIQASSFKNPFKSGEKFSSILLNPISESNNVVACLNKDNYVHVHGLTNRPLQAFHHLKSPIMVCF